jgi:asparagine synthase (glutamine-hydrolysing)
MFAFALWEPGSRRLTLARDRLGIKPLYYHQASGLVAFTSEVKALSRSGVAPDAADPEALPQFLLFGSVPSPLTTVKGIRCLPPGHYAVATHRGVTVKKYWDLRRPDTPPPVPISGEGAIEALRERLERAVREHLISDVPLGVFLSGGVDSAAIVALASRARKDQPLTTLTVAFGEKEFNEGPEAQRIARRFHTQHHELLVTSEDFAREMPVFLAGMDQPTNDGVNTWFVSRAARQCGLTVVLSGLGGDEVFWGYEHYRRTAAGAPVRRILERLPGFARRGLIAGAAAYGGLRGQEKWQRLSVLKNGITPEAMYYGVRGFFSARQTGRLLGLTGAEKHRMMESAISGLRPPASDGLSHAADVNQIEMRRYLHDQLLRDTDAFSMAHSIEVRVPFLDHEVVECAAALPASVKTDGALNKPVLVRAVQDAAVTEAGSRSKMGFTFPMDAWMKSQAGPLGEIARRAQGLERPEVAKAWQAFERGKLHWSQAWGLVVLGARA